MLRVKVKAQLLDVEVIMSQAADKVIDDTVVALEAVTPVLTGYAASRWRREGDRIVNDADYIDKLNAGSSLKAPAYFIESTVLSQPGLRPGGAIVRSK